jgi:hypothetical protein
LKSLEGKSLAEIFSLKEIVEKLNKKIIEYEQDIQGLNTKISVFSKFSQNPAQITKLQV